MPSENEVFLMGHLGQDHDTRYTPGGQGVTTLNVATTRRWKEQGSSEWKDKTDWHRCVCWNVHEKTLQYLRKGNLVRVRGRLQTRSYEDREGTTRYITEVIGHVYFLREPFRGGPRDEDAPPAGPEMPPITDDDVPF